MSIFVKATTPPALKTERVKQISLLYAVILVVMAVAQLYTFDTFVELVADFNLPLGGALAFIVAPLLVVFEVFALPFLLRMKLSPAFRVLSMASGWFAALIWLAVTLWLVTTHQAVETVGFLGTVGTLAPGWWAVLVSAALGILALWASWGMWPLTRSKK